jgi:mono/diheme cytochrome c family protein/glucose/arabinose dehydrogenase
VISRLSIVLVTAALAVGASIDEPSPALIPADALKAFHMPPGYRVELVASEPMIGDPIAIDIDPDGRLWVIEMRGFMPTADERNTTRAPLCRIVVLEDDDDDGKMDRRTVFLDKLVLPRTLKVLNRGVLVVEPPHLWLVHDENGDLRADRKEILRDDFGRREANPEHNANGLLWGLDNWIHTSEHDGMFKFRNGVLDHHRTVRRGQWGVTMDDAGRVYRNWNEQPAFVDLVPGHYYARNPNLTRTRGSYEPLMPPEEAIVWPVRPNRGVNRGYRTGWLRGDGTLITYVSAGAPTLYRGDRLPRELHGNLFVAEPAGNLVHRLMLVEEHGEVRAKNAYPRGEFLASTDERFRPVNLFSAADGTLYVVDMYRGIIQEGAYQTAYLQNYIKTHKLESPIGLGRIYRVVHESTRRDRRPALSGASPERLVELLSHPNGWWRDTAQRLLVERRATAVVAQLKTLIGAPDYRTRLHALWTLDGLDAVDFELVERLLADQSPHVRAAAVRVAERWPTDPRTQAVLVARLDDPDRSVRRQATASLGTLPASAREDALATALERFGDDQIVVDAALSGLAGREAAVLARVRRKIVVPPAKSRTSVVQPSTSVVQPFGAARANDIYDNFCAACHLPDGSGAPNAAPSLVNSKWVVGDPGVPVRIVLHGKEGQWMMPPLSSLSDGQIASALTFVRTAWGHTASAIDAGLVKQIRAATARRTRPWTEDELARLSKP